MLSFSYLNENNLFNGDTDTAEILMNTGLIGSGGLLTAGGSIDLKKILPDLNLAGREIYYHSTGPKAAESIKNTGLHVSEDGKAPNTSVFKTTDPERYKEALGKVYLRTDSKPNFGDSVVEVRLPKGKFTPIMNPEVDMDFSEWFRRSADKRTYEKYLNGEISPWGLKSAQELYNKRREDIVFPHNIDAEYIKGPKYKTPDISEVINNFKTNRTQFVNQLKTLAKHSTPIIGGVGLLGTGIYNSV